MSLETTDRTVEFGDFQTPSRLATEVCDLLAGIGIAPASVVEPTCGRGAFVAAALDAFPKAETRGYECNPVYAEAAQKLVAGHRQASVEPADFFEFDWASELAALPDPLLILGNPPWVTNAAVGSLGGRNLPQKTNIDALRGIEALTGHANFDISEWMLRENLRWLEGRCGDLAVLCKTSVARKVLLHAWSHGLPIESSLIFRLDSKRDFGVAVDACLFVVRTTPGAKSEECSVYESLRSSSHSSRFGLRDGRLISNLESYDRLSSLYLDGLTGWRSGVKHDCSRVFEFSREGDVFVNGLGETVSIESEVLFPLLKSSDVARGRGPRRFVLIPHRSMDQSPEALARSAPLAWRYLNIHGAILDARGSSIYKKRARFSIFGIGPYSFAPWKIAISGLYKHLTFAKVGPIDGRPVLLDDTCYFFPCDSEEECEQMFELVSSAPATDFWSSLVFWDSKRPITAKLLNALDLAALAKALDSWTPTTRRIAERQMTSYSGTAQQQMLFRESSLPYSAT